MKKIVAWILILIMVLSGCSMEQSRGAYDLVYTRPDMVAIMETLDTCCQVAETAIWLMSGRSARRALSKNKNCG